MLCGEALLFVNRNLGKYDGPSASSSLNVGRWGAGIGVALTNETLTSGRHDLIVMILCPAEFLLINGT